MYTECKTFSKNFNFLIKNTYFVLFVLRISIRDGIYFLEIYELIMKYVIYSSFVNNNKSGFCLPLTV